MKLTSIRACTLPQPTLRRGRGGGVAIIIHFPQRKKQGVLFSIGLSVITIHHCTYNARQMTQHRQTREYFLSRQTGVSKNNLEDCDLQQDFGCILYAAPNVNATKNINM